LLDDAGRAQAYEGTLEVQAVWASGEREHARRLAREAVERWPDYFASLEKYTQEQLVWRIDACRGDRMWSNGEQIVSYQEEQKINCFLLARYEPQHIAGVGVVFGGAGMLAEALARNVPAPE